MYKIALASVVWFIKLSEEYILTRKTQTEKF